MQKYIVLWICLGSLFLYACRKEEPTKQVNFLYTGELLGELEPCGCSGSKLGGMLLRSGWVEELKKESSLLLLDGGFASLTSEKQDAIKFTVHHKILKQLGYHYQFAGSSEKIPAAVADSPLLLGKSRKDQVEHAYQKTLSGVGILFLTMEKKMPPTSAKIQGLMNQYGPDVVFVFTKGIHDNYTSLLPEGEYSKIFFAVDAQAPFSPMVISPDILVLSAGNRGRYIGILNLSMQGKKRKDWKNRILALEKKYEPKPEVFQLLEEYKAKLKEERLLEFQIKRSSPIGFVGSENCYECHQEESNMWKTKKHAHAFDILVKEKHDYDPECVGCHTVGFAYEEGFRTPDETPHLMHVGCEECHGAGAEHCLKPVPGYGKTNGETVCLACHQKDRSPNFEYKKYLEMIKHWKD